MKHNSLSDERSTNFAHGQMDRFAWIVFVDNEGVSDDAKSTMEHSDVTVILQYLPPHCQVIDSILVIRVSECDEASIRKL